MVFVSIFILVITVFAYDAFARPHRVLALAICMFAFEQLLQSGSAFFVSKGYFVNASVMACIILATCRRLQSHFNRITIPSTYWLSLLLFAYAFSTLFWRTDYYNTWHGILWLSSLPYLVAVVFCGAILPLTIPSLRETLLTTLSFGVLVCAGLLFFTNWESRGIELASDDKEAVGAVLSLAQVGGYIAVIAGIIDARRVPAWAILRWIVVGVGLYLTFRTGSRGQAVAVLIVILICSPIRHGSITLRSLAFGMLTVVALILCVIAILPMVETDRWESQNLHAGVDDRVMAIQKVSGRYISGTPIDHIFGLGASASFPIASMYVHNLPLDVLFEEGLVGILLLAMILLVPSIKSVKVVIRKNHPDSRSRSPTDDRNTVITMFALFLFEFILLNKQGSLYGAHNLFLFAILLERSANQLLYSDRSRRPSRDDAYTTLAMDSQASENADVHLELGDQD